MKNYGNDPEKFEKFFRERHAGMILYAAKIVGDKEAARDIVQDVFAKTWENREKIEIGTSLETYLFRAVRNQCVNHYKHKSVEHKYTDSAERELREMESQFYSGADEQILRLFEKETGEMVRKTIGDLPDKCREIFEMSRYSGMENKEIASKLNISLRTVETQIYRALKELKDKLKKNIQGL